MRERECVSLGPFFLFFFASLLSSSHTNKIFFFVRLDLRAFFCVFLFSLLSSLLWGKVLKKKKSFFIHSLVGLYDGGSSIRCAHTREHHAVREREREEGEEEREGEEKKRNETDRKREREREKNRIF